MEQSPPWEANSNSASQEISRLLWNSRFITLFTTAPPPRCLSCASCVHSTPPHLISLRPVLVLSSIYAYVFRVVSSLQVFRPKFITHFSSLPCVLRARSCVTFHNTLVFHGEEAGLSAVCECLFNTFAATHHIRRPSPPSATRGCVMPWWQVPTYHDVTFS
jgi:hypothetical protein